MQYSFFNFKTLCLKHINSYFFLARIINSKLWLDRPKKIHRTEDIEDIGNAALFLASDACNYIIGSTLVVDGSLLIM